MYEVKIILDSLNAFNGVRLTTLACTYPRFVHPQIMSHRIFSRNASSSRAIPVKKMLEMAKNDPAMPIFWGKNQPGMIASEELKEPELTWAKQNWLYARDNACFFAQEQMNLGAHKQIVNRILEPYLWITTLITATEWDNFFYLRCDEEEPQKEVQMIAKMMRTALQDNTPEARIAHIPYLFEDELENLDDTIDWCKVSVARSARVSYIQSDGRREIEKDLDLYERLWSSKHLSPFEHVAIAQTATQPTQSGNFRGWDQYRKIIEKKIEGDTKVVS